MLDSCSTGRSARQLRKQHATIVEQCSAYTVRRERSGCQEHNWVSNSSGNCTFVLWPRAVCKQLQKLEMGAVL